MSAEDELQFVDTNVLAYAHDVSAGAKYARARDLIEHLWQTRRGCLSIQVLQEFYVVTTQKASRPLDRETATRIISDLSVWTVHRPSVGSVVNAIGIQARNRISFWDALIVASASELGCTTIWSEDLNPRQSYEAVTVINPFFSQ